MEIQHLACSIPSEQLMRGPAVARPLFSYTLFCVHETQRPKLLRNPSYCCICHVPLKMPEFPPRLFFASSVCQIKSVTHKATHFLSDGGKCLCYFHVVVCASLWDFTHLLCHSRRVVQMYILPGGHVQLLLKRIYATFWLNKTASGSRVVVAN